MNFRDTKSFYKSKEWESFRQIIIDERTDADGYVHCAICGKPILKKYDLIIHHKKELDDLNVNDVMISLNKDNVECVHFKCHNQIHNRFVKGHSATYKPVQKHAHIVYGSPCSGKTTWVRENATENDLIIDLDSIWEMISVNARYTKPDALRSVAFDMRDKLYDIVKYRSGKWINAYVIVGCAMKGERERLIKRVNADDLIFIDTEKDVCIERAKNRIDMTEDQKLQWISYINKWFEQYQPD